MHHPPNHIFEPTPDSLKLRCSAHSMKPFRATVILEGIFVQRIIEPAAGGIRVGKATVTAEGYGGVALTVSARKE